MNSFRFVAAFLNMLIFIDAEREQQLESAVNENKRIHEMGMVNKSQGTESLRASIQPGPFAERQEIGTNTKEIAEETKSLKAFTGESTVKVGFTAGLSKEVNVQAGSMLKFNKVVLNEGNGYSPYVGSFRVPVAGTYLFSYHIEHWDTPEIVVNLLVDGVVEASAVIFPHGSSTQSGNTVLLRLACNQHVWLQSKHNGKLFGSDDFIGNTFTGVLLH